LKDKNGGKKFSKRLSNISLGNGKKPPWTDLFNLSKWYVYKQKLQQGFFLQPKCDAVFLLAQMISQKLHPPPPSRKIRIFF